MFQNRAITKKVFLLGHSVRNSNVHPVCTVCRMSFVIKIIICVLYSLIIIVQFKTETCAKSIMICSVHLYILFAFVTILAAVQAKKFGHGEKKPDWAKKEILDYG
jgi:arginine exporter protein ArgO